MVDRLLAEALEAEEMLGEALSLNYVYSRTVVFRGIEASEEEGEDWEFSERSHLDPHQVLFTLN